MSAIKNIDTGDPERAALARPASVARLAALFPMVVAGYYGLHLVIRVALPGGAGLDDAEQFVAAQSWQWGYGPQPPLFTWIQRALFLALGESILAFALLRNLLLVATVLLVFQAGRRLGGPDTGLAAGASMLLLPQFAWESQHSHTHTTLVVALSAWALWAFLDLCAYRRARDYLLFGTATGLAVLAKFNGILLPLGLVLAALSLPAIRGVMLCRRFLLAPAAAVAIVAAPLLWMSAHPDLVLGRTRKFGFDPEAGVLTGGAELAVKATAFVALLVVVWAVLLWRYRGHPPALNGPGTWGRALVVRAVVAGLVLIFALVLASGATVVKERWLQPVLFAAPLAITLWGCPRLAAPGLRRLLWICGAIAITVLAAIPLHHRFGSFGKPPLRIADHAALLSRIEAATGPVGTVISNSHSLAGNFRLIRPGLVALTPEYLLPELALPRPVVLVWRLEPGSEDVTPPDILVGLARTRVDPDAAPGDTGLRSTVPWPWPFEGVYAVGNLSWSPTEKLEK